MDIPSNHRSGFVNIIGRPNVGKSTLMNALVGERMSIITSKPQTTRHRIKGIVSDDHFQLVFSDTPGIITDPAYKMQKAMNSFVNSTFEDADVILLVTDIYDKYEEDDALFDKIKSTLVPLKIVLNKIDQCDEVLIDEKKKWWLSIFPKADFRPISALEKTNIEGLLEAVVDQLPFGPPYYPKDQLTDKPERFFVSEIIREKILLLYKQEIPYSCEIIIEEYQEPKEANDEFTRIRAVIIVSRKTQKGIIIGKGGQSIKKLGIEARKDIEEFIQSKVYLELFVKVKENWRNDERLLKHFGYKH
jgi:GTP-binding protein Era